MAYLEEEAEDEVEEGGEVPAVDGLGGGLLVLAVCESEDPRCPGVAVIPVLGPGEGVPLAGPAGLRHVTDHVKHSAR